MNGRGKYGTKFFDYEYMIDIWKKVYLASPALHGIYIYIYIYIYIGALSNTGVT